jgi:hypothetical protein
MPRRRPRKKEPSHRLIALKQAAVWRYSIAMGHNEEIARRSGRLEGYSAFIGKVREGVPGNNAA